MVSFTIKHFRYFDALARIGHFGRAAEACAISQPALSAQIKELETLLGAPLVERAARKIRLTTLGEEFHLRARKILSDVEEMSELARLAGGPIKGTLRMGIIPTVAPYLLPAIIRGLSSRIAVMSDGIVVMSDEIVVKAARLPQMWRPCRLMSEDRADLIFTDPPYIGRMSGAMRTRTFCARGGRRMPRRIRQSSRWR